LLDNMDDAALAAAVKACRAAAAAQGAVVLTEASGSIGLARMAALRRSGVDRVSSSGLTLAAPVDFGLDER
jgi:nicotinate-nucleotide pyrophosphorylase